MLAASAPILAVADDKPAAAAEAPVEETDPALEFEIRYVEALIEYGYPDFAEPVIEVTVHGFDLDFPDVARRLLALAERLAHYNLVD